MFEIQGSCNTAVCYAKVIEDKAKEQIRQLCDSPLSAGSRIRIMPDVHAGKGCTVGTTMTVTDKVCPNLVGVDIGCGMYTVKLDAKTILFIYLIGMGSVIVSTIIPLAYTLQLKPRKILL